MKDLGTPLMRLKHDLNAGPEGDVTGVYRADLVKVLALVDLATKWAAAREDLLSTVGVDAEKLNDMNLAAADLSLGLAALTSDAPPASDQ